MKLEQTINEMVLEDRKMKETGDRQGEPLKNKFKLNNAMALSI